MLLCYYKFGNVCAFFDVLTDFLLMKDSAGVCTPLPKSPSILLVWHQSQEPAPWMSVSGATETTSSASTGSPSPLTSGIFLPETVSDMIIRLIQKWICQYFCHVFQTKCKSIILMFCRWWQGLCAVVGSLWWHQWPQRWVHAGIQREVPASQERLCLLERTGLQSQHRANPVSVHLGWLPVVRHWLCPNSMTYDSYTVYTTD